jgi:hypothetical protein
MRSLGFQGIFVDWFIELLLYDVLLQVIVRIFYSVNRSWSGRITAAELRQANFLQVLLLLAL